jgi:hypothetical protein
VLNAADVDQPGEMRGQALFSLHAARSRAGASVE